jgi:hypothetical protein
LQPKLQTRQLWNSVNHAVDSQHQTLDFERALQGWAKSGSAFDSQPVAGAITTDRAKVVKIGGEDWRRLHHPVGHHGNYLIFSDDAATGTLTSALFT